MSNPVDIVFPLTGPGNRGAVAALLKYRYDFVVQSAAELRGDNFSGHLYVTLASTGLRYKFSATETGADDGVAIIRDLEGNAFVASAGAPGLALANLLKVNDLTARAAYDDEDEGFTLVVLDCTGETGGAGRSALYVMGAGGSGDWSYPGYITGPKGADGTISSDESIGDMRAMTQAEYDALDPKVSTTIYFIKEA